MNIQISKSQNENVNKGFLLKELCPKIAVRENKLIKTSQ